MEYGFFFLYPLAQNTFVLTTLSLSERYLCSKQNKQTTKNDKQTKHPQKNKTKVK